MTTVGNKRIPDLIGKRFGKLIVTSFLKKDSYNCAVWSCICDCGGTTSSTTATLRSGDKRSCGCLSKRFFRNLEGQKYNNITIGKLIGKNNYSCYIYNLHCDCGKIFIGEGNDIKSGKIKSCGCFKNRSNKESTELAFGKSVYRDYKVKAKQREIEFDLSIDFFISQILKPCYYCGIEPRNLKKARHRDDFLIYNGLDRKDNDKGYLESNVVPCCRICNQAKHSLTEDVFISWIDRIYNFRHNGRLI